MTLKRNTIPRHGVVRVHTFPPLRKNRHGEMAHGGASLDPAEYQQQLMNGFQEGLNNGYEQGLEQGREEGYQTGHQQGYDAGLQKGRSEGKIAGRHLFEQASQPFAGLSQQLQQVLDEHEQRRRTELLQLVEKVTRQVIRCELALQPTQLLALVEEALSSLPDAPSRLKVSLNPLEFARISEAEPQKVAEWGMVADESLEPGECRVETDTSDMDVGCSHRLDQCMDVLTQTLTATENADE
ncbi:flagellar assembly protein H [Rahnella sp. PD12R]|uniref:flagellar assembly protein FliH n=1 Tax=Rahnella sp. PD12R TaxID=2855688 RepID=UPI001C45022D|nr:flagellar assembly protein FliH [Rahnella sp. PD12R]MBV6820063.1 flagellar assembly protein H [Rahnella sp. PD12R]